MSAGEQRLGSAVNGPAGSAPKLLKVFVHYNKHFFFYISAIT